MTGRSPRVGGGFFAFGDAQPYDAYVADIITSFGNPMVKRIKKLHRGRGRAQAGLTLVEGPMAFGQMAAAGVVPEVVLVIESDDVTLERCDSHGWIPSLVTPEILASAGEAVHPQSPVAAIRIPDKVALRSRDTVILNDISDPGNVGTIIRSAAAFGWDVSVSGATADPWSPKVLRSGVGSHFGMHISFSDDPVVDARAVGLEVVAAVVVGGSQAVRSDRSVALMIGSEVHGLSDEDTERADRAVTLTMPGEVESLNAAVAASILMFALARS